MSTVSTPTIKPAYPATLEVDYPEGGRNRLTSFFRIIVVIPIAIILGLLTSAAMQSGSGNQAEGLRVLGAGGILFMPLVLMILFRKKYPKWWFDWNLNLTRFSYRVSLFLGLLRDEYPSTDEEQAVHLNLVYPDARTQLGRGWPLIKWFLAIPHYIVLFFLYIGAIVVGIIAWFAILFTGRYPRGLFDYTVGVSRWALRVEAYAILLITDQYPPFSLS
ncbi:MAG: rane protein [Chloroflexi bacterium]|nr:rane protein [Chloroflexota bacterium]